MAGKLLSGTEAVALPWLSIWAFLRISTNPRLNERPLLAGEAMAIEEELLAHSLVSAINPGRRHGELLLSQMIQAAQGSRPSLSSGQYANTALP